MNKEEVLLSILKEGELEIDTQGRVWRLKKRHGRGVMNGGGYAKGVRASLCPRVRAEFRQRQGYLMVTTTIQGKRATTGAHRLVWVYFNDVIPAGITINHKNGQKDDNRPSNLELATYQQQNRHTIYVLGKNQRVLNQDGIQNHAAKLTEASVRQMRQERLAGWNLNALAEKYRIAFQTVSEICRRQAWRHLD